MVLAVIESTVSANIAATERVLAIYKEGGHLAVVGGLRTIVWQVLQHELAPLPHTVLKVRNRSTSRTCARCYRFITATMNYWWHHLSTARSTCGRNFARGLWHNGADLIETSIQLLREIWYDPSRCWSLPLTTIFGHMGPW